MACFFCNMTNSKICGGSCGLCGGNCPGYEPEGLPNGMVEHDYDFSEY